ncbi:hypothetical protein F2Q69_00011798 [Brassica cretica]|uniref:Uncharacterized protein n=1 Tax=Brassica cretica TaxID=69181 RepID=A0A8S9R7J5_BRACR|nr:hypothetical protein F2Q69_00011798 [Brassica cretica]
MGSLKILSVVFVPEIVCHKRDLSKSFDPKALPGEQVAESTKKGLKERLARGQGSKNISAFCQLRFSLAGLENQCSSSTVQQTERRLLSLAGHHIPDIVEESLLELRFGSDLFSFG